MTTLNYPIALECSPDSKTILTINHVDEIDSSDVSLNLFDTETRELLWTCNHTYVRAAKFSPCGRFIFLRGNYYITQLERDTAILVNRFESEHHLCDMTINADGTTLTTLNYKGIFEVWDVKQGNILNIIQGFVGHRKSIYTAKFSPDNKFVIVDASELYNTATRLVSAKTGHGSKIFEDAKSPLLFSTDTKFLIAQTSDFDLTAFNIQTTKPAVTFKGHTDKITSTDINHENSLLVSCSLDQTLRIWNFKTGECLKTHNYETPVDLVKFSPDGKTLTAISENNLLIFEKPLALFWGTLYNESTF